MILFDCVTANASLHLISSPTHKLFTWLQHSSYLVLEPRQHCDSRCCDCYFVFPFILSVHMYFCAPGALTNPGAGVPVGSGGAVGVSSGKAQGAELHGRDSWAHSHTHTSDPYKFHRAFDLGWTSCWILTMLMKWNRETESFWRDAHSNSQLFLVNPSNDAINFDEVGKIKKDQFAQNCQIRWH